MPSTHTREQFIERSIAIHGSRYVYDAVLYDTQYSRVTIECLDHGPFVVSARRHVRGVGCPKCDNSLIDIPKRGGKKPVKTTEQFIADARRVHGNKYEYESTQYRGAQVRVTITCPTHGQFEQLATNHLSGYGCSLCAIHKVFHERHIPKSEQHLPAWVYVLLIDVDDNVFAKLGYTTDFANRRSHLKCQRVFVDKSCIFETTKLKGFQIEQDIHHSLSSRKALTTRRFGGSTECYPPEMYGEILSQVESRIRHGKIY